MNCQRMSEGWEIVCQPLKNRFIREVGGLSGEPLGNKYIVYGKIVYEPLKIETRGKMY